MLFRTLAEWAERRIILASGSPRRKELLGMMGLTFDVVPSQFDEKSLNKADYSGPCEFVEVNASKKALEVASRSKDFDLIIGSDSVVVVDEKVLEKPESEAQAIEMLTMLSGRTHYVTSGVALVTKAPDGQPVVQTFHSKTEVTFAELEPEEILAYVALGDYADKAGGYGIQSKASLFITGISGDYYTVVGLPVHQLAAKMHEIFMQRSVQSS
eukprot:m.361882 g.361882  ORF g.361882 m.361882 type:complete len:213 (-) comp19957_c0_seq1:85-723(-)